MRYFEAIRAGLVQALRKDPNVVCFGLGIDDPKGIFGTTLDLHREFGQQRIFDMPTAENGMTGIAIGAALNGLKPVMVHQRLDFFLLAMDQLVNNAAKWHYMFGGQCSVPLTIRLILGRGWGQGPTHSQSLQSWFMHIPGLKIVAPAFADDAKGLLLASIFDPNPVLFLEHRWLHNLESHVAEDSLPMPFGKARVVREGGDATIVAYSYQTVEALEADATLRAAGVHCDIIDLRSLSPLDWDTVFQSVRKTGRLLALDTSHATCSVASEIISRVSRECFSALKCAPEIIALPDFPSPTSAALTKVFYPSPITIVERVAAMLGRSVSMKSLEEKLRMLAHDVPGPWFKGPF